MTTNGPLHTGYDNGIVDTPSVGESTRRGEAQPLPNTSDNGSSKGLTGTPFEHPIFPPPASGEATANASGIPNDWLVEKDVKDAPSPGTVASVAGGVATPNTPAGNMAGGKDGENIGIGKS